MWVGVAGEVSGERRGAARSTEATDATFEGVSVGRLDCAILGVLLAPKMAIWGSTHSADNLGATTTFAHHVACALAHFAASHAAWIAGPATDELNDGLDAVRDDSTVV